MDLYHTADVHTHSLQCTYITRPMFIHTVYNGPISHGRCSYTQSTMDLYRTVDVHTHSLPWTYIARPMFIHTVYHGPISHGRCSYTQSTMDLYHTADVHTLAVGADGNAAIAHGRVDNVVELLVIQQQEGVLVPLGAQPRPAARRAGVPGQMYTI